MKKYLVLFFFTAGLAILDACGYGYPCKCSKVLPFFDYSSLRSDTYILKGNLKLRFKVFPDSLDYVASLAQPCRIPWTTMAYGCDCVGNGSQGAKVEVDSFTITADKPFAPEVPAGASLSDYFKIAPIQYGFLDTIPHADMYPLDQASKAEALKYDYYNTTIGLVKDPVFLPIEGFIFTITAHKRDGTKASYVTGPTGW